MPPAVGVVEAIVVVVGVEKMTLDEVTGLEKAVEVGDVAVVLGTTDTEAELTGIMLVSTLDKLAASMRAARATWSRLGRRAISSKFCKWAIMFRPSDTGSKESQPRGVGRFVCSSKKKRDDVRHHLTRGIWHLGQVHRPAEGVVFFIPDAGRKTSRLVIPRTVKGGNEDEFWA